MKENVDKLSNIIVKKAIRTSNLESPSSDFTNHIMAHVRPKSTAIVYRPLISRTGWILIFGSVITFVVFSYLNLGVDTNEWFQNIDLHSILTNGVANFFSKLKFDQITSYAMLVCGIMLCAQIPILKHFMDKK